MKVALVCCPSWSIEFPPYNISLLKAVLKENEHEAKTFDFNIEAYQYLLDDEIEFWNGHYFFMWEHGEFDKIILPKISDLMDEWIDSVLAYEPDFIGLPAYHTSIRCITHFIQRLRKKNDKIKIILGGPQCFSAGQYPPFMGLADYISTGEGEQVILDVLNYPEGQALSPTKPTRINEIPTPDYDDCDLSLYKLQGGISLEASRGCIAKCAFCIETHYWAYRSKKAEVIVAEMKKCIEKYESTHFRFNDSLVNGNIKEFRRLVDILCEDKLPVTWDAYARIDGRMDLEFMKRIKESGNRHLSYGVETGSQKILDDMRKGITVEEVEQNLKDGFEADVLAHINWMVGFPTETPLDHMHSLAFLFNTRHYMNSISPGMTCGIGDKAELQMHGERFNVDETYYWGNWITKDFSNTAPHRWIRLKCTHIWLYLLEISNGQAHDTIDKQFILNSHNDQNFITKRIETNKCPDLSYIYDGSYESSLRAEFLAFFWIMFQAYGQYEMSLTFDKERDIADFGTMIAKEYDAEAKFQINKNGKWTFSLDHEIYHHKPFKKSTVMEGNF